MARGYSPGVYRKWEEAKQQVEGFRDAKHERFSTRKAAEAFVEKYRTRKSAKYDSSEGSSDPSSIESDTSSVEARPCQRPSRKKTSYPSKEYMGPDKSIGQEEQFFEMETADVRSMVTAMTPPAIAFDMGKRMAEAAFDAVQLPGRCSAGKEDDDPVSIVEAIQDLNEDRRSGEGPRRDVQWRASNRTSLRALTSHNALQARLTELQDLRREVFKNQLYAYKAILYELPWDEVSVELWAQHNWYQRIGWDTFENYLNLHRHLIDISLQQGWEYAEISLKYHSTKLANIRTQAPSRLCCLVRLYIFLRDANHKSFYSEKLQEKRNREVRENIEALKTGGSGGASGLCPKCGMGMHAGGAKHCPLRGLSDADGRKKMTSILEQLAKLKKEDWERMHANNE